MQFQAALLRLEKNAHQALRLLAEDAVGRRANLAVHEQKSVHRLHRCGAPGQPCAQRKPAGRRRQQGQALFERARDEENVPHVRVEVAHEFLDALAGRAVGVAEAVRDGGLQVFPQGVQRAVGVIVQLRPCAQQKIVGGLKLLAFGLADKFPLLQFAQRARAVFEKRHPQQVLEIAQAAAAIFEVRLLHAGRVAIFGAPRQLVFQPQGDVFFLEAVHTFRHQRLLKFFEQRLIARDQPRLDERRFGLHVGVGDLYAVVNAAD